MTLIPKKIFQTISNKENLDKRILENIEFLKRINPDFEYQLYDDNDCYNFIKNNYDQYILNAYEKINSCYGPAKADLFRYLLMYKYGGVYLDIKSTCIKPFSYIIKDDDEYILSYWSSIHPSGIFVRNLHGEFQQWHIICVPEHPFLKAVIDKVISNIYNYDIKKNGVGKQAVLNITGPYAYTRAILPIKIKHKHILYKNHKYIGLKYDIFDHIKYFGNNHYSLCKEKVII